MCVYVYIYTYIYIYIYVVGCMWGCDTHAHMTCRCEVHGRTPKTTQALFYRRARGVQG